MARPGRSDHGLGAGTHRPRCPLVYPGCPADIARFGKGGAYHFSFSLHLLLIVSASGDTAHGWPIWDRQCARIWFSSVRQAIEIAFAALEKALAVASHRFT